MNNVDISLDRFAYGLPDPQDTHDTEEYEELNEVIASCAVLVEIMTRRGDK